MKKFVIKRILLVVPTLFLVSVLSFVLTYKSAEDVAYAILVTNQNIEFISDEMVEDFIEKEGLEKSAGKMYLKWLNGAICGDFGKSLRTKESISDVIVKASGKTLAIAVIAFFVMIFIGMPIGFASAYRENGVVDKFGNLLCALTMSTPPYWIGLLAMYLFAMKFKWRFVIGYNGFPSLLTLGVILGIVSSGGIIRIIRSKTSIVLREQYIEQANAQGISVYRIFFGHVLKNVLPPVISVMYMQFSGFISGSVILEKIFSVPGVGYVTINAMNAKDMPLISAVVLYLGVFVAFLNLCQDVTSVLLDKRNVGKLYAEK